MIGSGFRAVDNRLCHCLVSILVVLDDWFGLKRGPTMPTDPAEFQSLLFWMIGSGYGAIETTRPDYRVSILVVLDDWFGHDLPTILGLLNPGFNPCCFG